MTTWDPITNQRIALLHPLVRDLATTFINTVEQELGIRLRIAQSLRSIAEQDNLYAQGRTKPGKVVTNARGGSSFHNYGLAWDVVEIKAGLANWNAPWEQIAKIARRLGIEWGGDFKSIVDKPHFQKSFGYSTQQLHRMITNGNSYPEITPSEGIV